MISLIIGEPIYSNQQHDSYVIIDDRQVPDRSEIVQSSCKNSQIGMRIDISYSWLGKISDFMIYSDNLRLSGSAKIKIIERLKHRSVSGVTINNCFLRGAPLSVNIDIFTFGSAEDPKSFGVERMWFQRENGEIIVKFERPRTDVEVDKPWWKSAPKPQPAASPPAAEH